MKLYLILIFFICLTLYSCTASNTTSTPEISFEVLKSRVNENAAKLKSLDADGEISIDSPNLSNTGTITVSINKPDSIFTKLEGPFGIDIANLLITRSNFTYYNVMENKVIRGPSTPHYLSIIMKIKVDFDDIINAFSGKFTFGNETYDDIKIGTEENNYIVSLKKSGEIKKFWINSDDYYVSKLGTYDATGNTKLEILYENFYQKDGISFPKKITITRPGEKQNIWLNYSKEEFNNNILSYKLKIPKSAKQINWNDN